MMLDAIRRCDSSVVRRLLTTPYVLPDDPKARYIEAAIVANCTHSTRLDVLEVLLEAGADPNLVDGPNTPLLSWIANSARPDPFPEVKLLIDHGLNVRRTFSNGNTYFHMFSWPSAFRGVTTFAGVVPIYELLIASGVDPQSINRRWQTSLVTHSMIWGSVEQAAFLLDKGVNLDFTDGCKMTAIDYTQMVHTSGFSYTKLSAYPEFRQKSPEAAAKADALFAFLRSRGAVERALPDHVILHCVDMQ